MLSIDGRTCLTGFFSPFTMKTFTLEYSLKHYFCTLHTKQCTCITSIILWSAISFNSGSTISPLHYVRSVCWAVTSVLPSTFTLPQGLRMMRQKRYRATLCSYLRSGPVFFRFGIGSGLYSIQPSVQRILRS